MSYNNNWVKGMARKGYRAEYLAKQKLIERYGKENVLKLAIGMSSDFLILRPGSGKIEKIVEVKSTVKEKWYPKPRDKAQLERLKALAKEHDIPLELWIKLPRKDFKVERVYK